MTEQYVLLKEVRNIAKEKIIYKDIICKMKL